jgi:hypothetical protein
MKVKNIKIIEKKKKKKKVNQRVERTLTHNELIRL